MILMHRLCLPLLLGLLALACGDRATAPYPTSLPPSHADSAVGPADIFDVRVFGEPGLSGNYQIATDGTIDFPLLGTLTVAGLTPPEIAKELRQRLSDGYLKNPQVSVLVQAYLSKKVSIIGQVRQPGTFSYGDNMSIVEAVTKAGGFTALAKKNSVRVTRKGEGTSSTATIVVAVEDISRGKAPNFLLKPGDVIFVPERVF
jgi:polysaccharide export outer membrane protein